MNHRKLIKVISLYELLIILVDNGLGHISRENVIFDDYITPKLRRACVEAVCVGTVFEGELFPSRILSGLEISIGQMS